MEVTKYSISEGAKKGLSAITRKANEEGIVFITKNDEPYSMVIPLTARGLKMLANKYRDSVNIDGLPEELRDIYSAYNSLMNKID